MTKQDALNLIDSYFAEGCTSSEWVECLKLCKSALTDSPDNSTLNEAVNLYGKDAQLVIAIEELSELTKELCKDKRGIGVPEHIAEEVADVSIILQELILIYGNEKEVEEWRQKKIERLQKGMIESGNFKG